MQPKGCMSRSKKIEMSGAEMAESSFRALQPRERGYPISWITSGYIAKVNARHGNFRNQSTSCFSKPEVYELQRCASAWRPCAPLRGGLDDRWDLSHVQFHDRLAELRRRGADRIIRNIMHSRAGGLLAHFSAEPSRLSYTQAQQA
jgi:hypothetical protein